MRTRLLALVVVLLVAAGLWFFRPRTTLETAWVGERNATVWNRLAVVRDPLTSLRYGERIEILERKNDYALVRTASRIEGWVAQRALVTPDAWRQREILIQQAAARPVQSRGQTRAIANVRLEPRRDASRIFQFPSDTPVEFLARTTVEAPSQPADSPAAGDAPSEAPAPAESTNQPRRDEWWFIRAKVSEAGSKEPLPIAGWVLSTLLQTNPPAPLVDYSAGLRFVAWFELGSTPESDGPRPRYVAFGLRPGDNPLCDFTLLRVFNWSLSRKRYETAYVESALCGKLPVTTSSVPRPPSRWAPPATDYSFRFENLSPSGKQQRNYSTRGNLVRHDRSSPLPK